MKRLFCSKKAVTKMQAVIIAVIIVVAAVAGGAAYYFTLPEKPPEKEKIKIGVAHDLSGPYSPGTPDTQGHAFDMWIDQLNAKGGIYVEEYDKRIPVELTIYDDTGDHLTCKQLYEKLITEDEVDLILPPYSTGIVLAVAPLANEYEYPMIGIACAAVVLLEMEFPYFFYMLPQVWDQAPDLAKILGDVGVERVAIIWVYEEHGIQMTTKLLPELVARGIEISMFKSYPPEVDDLSPLIKEADALNVDAFIAVSYPADSVLVTSQARALDYNPKVFFVGVGSSYPWYRNMFDGAEGVMGWGAWSPKQTPELQAWCDDYVEYCGFEPCYWATAYTWASLQVLEQAVEKAGTLDRTVIRDVLETETFDTILGPVSFLDDPYHYHDAVIGTIGQWQNGMFEVLAPADNATATAVYPKPPWP